MGGEEECIQDVVGKARRKESTRKTKTDVCGWTVLKLILERCYGALGIGLIWLRSGSNGGLL
jgi:hypothetical protein